MHKMMTGTLLDSYLKESQRLNVLLSVVMHRQTVKGFTFSGGTFTPKGTPLFAAASAIHHDDDFYENANPWRFFDKHAQVNNEVEDTKYRLESTSTEYLPFALGKSPWCVLTVSLQISIVWGYWPRHVLCYMR